MAIYNLIGKADIWWKDIKRAKGIKDKDVNWSTFKWYFKKKFLSEQYYEEKYKELYDLKLGTMNMKELNNKFLNLLRYVPYLVEEKPKIQRYLSCLPFNIKDRIEYDNPKTLEEAMRKATLCYDTNRKREGISNWKSHKPSNFELKKKNFRFSGNSGFSKEKFSKSEFSREQSQKQSAAEFYSSKKYSQCYQN